MRETTKNKGYLHGAAVLAAGVAIVRIIGAVFRIPLANILGPEGMSTYQVGFSVYQFLLIISTAGLPVALSKMVASADALGQGAQVKRVYIVGRNAFVLIGFLSFLIMAAFHRPLATHLLQSPSAAYAILALAPAVFFVGLISAYRGYCQGLSEMMPTSVSQIIEALSRLFLGLGLAWLFARRGFSSPMTVAGAIGGTTAGAVLAAGYLFLAKQKVERNRPWAKVQNPPEPTRQIVKTLRDIAIPLTLGAATFSLITIINNSVTLWRLQTAAGLDYVEAQYLHGTFSMTTSLFNMPSSFIIPITVALIPAISAFLAQGNEKEAQKISESGIRVACLLALPAGAGLIVLSSPIMHVLFSEFAPQGPGILAWMGIAAFFLCFFQATNCILQAYGFQRFTMYTLPVGGIIGVGLNFLLLPIPQISIYGTAISMAACYTIISLMNLILVKRHIPNPPSFRRALLRPFFCTLIMAGAAWGTFGLVNRLVTSAFGDISSRLAQTFSLTLAIGLAGLVYLILIVATKALTFEDLKMLPKGEKLARILRVG